MHTLKSIMAQAIEVSDCESLKSFKDILGKDDKIPIGKHKGWTVFQCLHSDPEYLYWLHNNTNVRIEKELYQQCCEEVAGIKGVRNSFMFDITNDSGSDLPF